MSEALRPSNLVQFPLRRVQGAMVVGCVSEAGVAEWSVLLRREARATPPACLQLVVALLKTYSQIIVFKGFFSGRAYK